MIRRRIVASWRASSRRSSNRRSAATTAAQGIHHAHSAAQKKGASSYRDPATGYRVITEDAHLGRGWCCGNLCRHCPYGGFGVPAEYGGGGLKELSLSQPPAWWETLPTTTTTTTTGGGGGDGDSSGVSSFPR